MKTMLKKWIAALLVCVLVLSGSGCMCLYIAAEILEADETPAPELYVPVQPMPDGETTEGFQRTEIKFSDMTYARPDIDAIRAAIESLLADAEAETADGETILARYNEILEMYEAADSQLAMAYVLYAFDVTESHYQDEYSDLVVALSDIDLSLTDLSIALFENQDSGERMEETFGEDFEETVYTGEKLNSPEIQAYVEQEQKLTAKYDTLRTTFVLEDGGRTYTMEQINEIAATDYEEYERLFHAYHARFNEQAGPLYFDLATLRDRIAKTLDYDSYADYMYDCYGRDYSTEEVAQLQAAVKTYFAPLYAEISGDFYYSWENDGYAAIAGLRIPMSNFLNKLQVVLEDFSPQTLEALNFMLRNDLYTASVSDKKMESCFTTYFDDYESPFIFMQWEDDIASASTVIHELGHFTNYYSNPASGWSVTDTLDLAEIDSQGLELLLIDYYDDLFGGYAEAAKTMKLLDGLYAVISGCMEDEFQQAVYANPRMTLDEANALYARLAQEYCLTEYRGTEWAGIPHSFQSPLYYISYAVSMIPALELWEMARTDRDGASAAYHAILQRPTYSELRALTAENGLADPIAPETIRHLAEVLGRTLRD